MMSNKVSIACACLLKLRYKFSQFESGLIKTESTTRINNTCISTGSLYRLLAAAFALLFIVKMAFAYGIMLDPGQIILDDLKIGHSYDINKISRPFFAHYSGSENMNIVIDVYPFAYPDPGYEPIPNADWVKVEKSVYSVSREEIANVHCSIAIPYNKKYLGRKFEVAIRASLKPRSDTDQSGVGLGIGVQMKVLISISKDAGAQMLHAAEEDVREAAPVSETGSILIDPSVTYLEGVPVGITVNMKKDFNKTLKLVNHGNRTAILFLRPVTPQDSQVDPSGYEPVDGKDILRFSKDKIEIGAGKSDEVNLYFRFQDKPQYHNKKFLVMCESYDNGDTALKHSITKIFIHTR